MSITKLSPNWTYQMGPIHFINFLLSGVGPNGARLPFPRSYDSMISSLILLCLPLPRVPPFFRPFQPPTNITVIGLLRVYAAVHIHCSIINTTITHIRRQKHLIGLTIGLGLLLSLTNLMS